MLIVKVMFVIFMLIVKFMFFVDLAGKVAWYNTNREDYGVGRRALPVF